MSRLILISSLLGAAVLLAACQQTAPVQRVAATANTNPAPAAQQQAAPTVEFRLAQARAAKNLMEVRLADGSIWVLPVPVLTRGDLNGVGPVKNTQGQTFVSFAFNEAGAKKLAAISQQNAGNLLMLSINGNLAAVPQIGGPMTQGVLNVPVANEQAALGITNAILGAPAASKK